MRPEVIVDFVFEEGLLFVRVENIGARPAHGVTVEFEPAFTGLGGTRKVAALALFHNLRFLAPRRAIMTFLDSSAAYFGRGEPTRIRATVRYGDGDEGEFEESIEHDLEIYREIAWVVSRERPPGTGS